jgi:hypothetical protein
MKQGFSAGPTGHGKPVANGVDIAAFNHSIFYVYIPVDQRCPTLLAPATATHKAVAIRWRWPHLKIRDCHAKGGWRRGVLQQVRAREIGNPEQPVKPTRRLKKKRSIYRVVLLFVILRVPNPQLPRRGPLRPRTLINNGSVGFLLVAMGPKKTPETRLLSPLRLPFRHAGLSFI